MKKEHGTDGNAFTSTIRGIIRTDTVYEGEK